MLVSPAGELESKSQDTVYASTRKDRLLDGHLLVAAFIEPTANARVLSFVVFPHHAEINLAGLL